MRHKKQTDYSTLSSVELEEHADRLLSGIAPRPGRKRRRDYPWLTERQLRSRQNKEVPMYGDLLEVEIARRRSEFRAL